MFAGTEKREEAHEGRDEEVECRQEDINDNVVEMADEPREKEVNRNKRPRIEDNTDENMNKDITYIEETVDNIIKEMRLIPSKSKQSPLKRIMEKINLILGNVKLSNTVQDLEKVVICKGSQRNLGH